MPALACPEPALAERRIQQRRGGGEARLAAHWRRRRRRPRPPPSRRPRALHRLCRPLPPPPLPPHRRACGAENALPAGPGSGLRRRERPTRGGAGGGTPPPPPRAAARGGLPRCRQSGRLPPCVWPKTSRLQGPRERCEKSGSAGIAAERHFQEQCTLTIDQLEQLLQPAATGRGGRHCSRGRQFQSLFQ